MALGDREVNDRVHRQTAKRHAEEGGARWIHDGGDGWIEGGRMEGERDRDQMDGGGRGGSEDWLIDFFAFCSSLPIALSY